MPIAYNLCKAFKKLYKIEKLEKYLPNKLPLSLTKPDKWLSTFIG